MGSDLIDRYTAIKEENTREERRVTPLRTKERSVTYRGSEEIPQKVIEKLEATELKDDNDTDRPGRNVDGARWRSLPDGRAGRAWVCKGTVRHSPRNLHRE